VYSSSSHPSVAVPPLRPAAPRVAPPLSLHVVPDATAFDALAPEWDGFVARAGIPHPFLTHDWLRTWWACLGNQAAASLHVVLVRGGGEIVAAAPMMRGRARLYGLPLTRLVSLHNDHTPRSEVLLDPRVPEAAEALWQALRPRQARSLLELREVPAHLPVLAQYRALARAEGMRVGTWDANASPYLRLDGTWDDYLAKLSDKLRGNIRRRTKGLARFGPVTPEVVTGGDLAEALADGLRIEAAGWKGRGGTGTAMACQPELVRFYAEFAERAAARGWLRLLFLRAGDRRVAFTYALEYANRLFLLKRGYDPEFASYSPTQLQMYELIRDGFERRLTAIEFLGDADPWKLEWTSTVRRHVWMHVFPDSLAGRALHAAKYQVLPALRQHESFARVRQLLVRAPGKAPVGRADAKAAR
jgi:CelD/BcsL family acetyltransferase involved in cellulose biosynthesis